MLPLVTYHSAYRKVEIKGYKHTPCHHHKHAASYLLHTQDKSIPEVLLYYIMLITYTHMYIGNIDTIHSRVRVSVAQSVKAAQRQRGSKVRVKQTLRLDVMTHCGKNEPINAQFPPKVGNDTRNHIRQMQASVESLPQEVQPVVQYH